jgi:ribosomal protein S18 acetylase RimI-like enzyme
MPTDAVLRSPTLDDVEEVVKLINDESARLTGSSDTEVDEEEVRGWWTQPPPFDLARDVCVAEQHGTIVGYGDLGDAGNDGAVFWLDVRGPAAADVLPELERRALARARPDGVLRAVCDSTDRRLAVVLAERGYTAIRASYRMLIELPGRTFTPVLPADSSIRVAGGPEEDELLHSLGQRSFADHWGFVPSPLEEWRHWMRNVGEPDPTLWFVAEVGDEPAGISLCRPTMHGNPDGGWVSTLGVLPSFRGRGLGTALLVHSFAELQRRGRTRVGLGVDAENTTGAVRLYERAGMRVVRRWDTWERPA